MCAPHIATPNPLPASTTRLHPPLTGLPFAGDIAAEQPKAAGSSLLAKLTHLLAADALEAAGLREVGQALVVPLATGMAITATLLALRGTRPPAARCAAWLVWRSAVAALSAMPPCTCAPGGQAKAALVAAPLLWGSGTANPISSCHSTFAWQVCAVAAHRPEDVPQVHPGLGV